MNAIIDVTAARRELFPKNQIVYSLPAYARAQFDKKMVSKLFEKKKKFPLKDHLDGRLGFN